MSPSPNQINSLYSRILSGDAESLRVLKELAMTDSNAAYYVAEIYNKGYYQNTVDKEQSFAYYGLAAYLGHDVSSEYLKNSKDSRAKRCLSYIDGLGYDGEYDLDRLISVLKDTAKFVVRSSKTDGLSEQDEAVLMSTSPVEYHKRKRDEYNNKCKQSREKRDELHRKIKELTEKVKILKGQRDEFNALVKKTKLTRNRLTDELNALREEKDLAKDPMPIVQSIRLKKKEAEEQHKLVLDYVSKAQAIHDELSGLSQEIQRLHNEADVQHAKSIEYKELSDKEHLLFIESKNTNESPNVSEGETAGSATEDDSIVDPEQGPDLSSFSNRGITYGKSVFFIDFNRNLDTAPSMDPTFGSSLNEQFKTISVKTKYLDASELFQDIFLKERLSLNISSPSFIKRWETDKKFKEITYFKNVAVRVEFTKSHDIVLIANIVLNSLERYKIGCRLEVKGFVFTDAKLIHHGELCLTGMPVLKLGSSKTAPWVDVNGPYSMTNFNNLIDETVISYLRTHYVTEDRDCVEYMQSWKKYLDSRKHVLEINESQKIDLSSVNLQGATFCDECTEELRSRYESIPYLSYLADKKQGWFIGNVEEDNCRRVLLLHITKEFSNEVYQKYVDKTDYSFKKQFDQFTRDGLKLFGKSKITLDEEDDESSASSEYKKETFEESIIDTYDTRISNVYVQILNPDAKIQDLQKKYADRHERKDKELLKIRDNSIDP